MTVSSVISSLIIFFTRYSYLAIFAEDNFQTPGRDLGAKAYEGVSALIWGLLLIVAIPVFILIIRAVVRQIQERKNKRFIEDMLNEAERNERAGKFVSAGLIHEKLKNPERAAGLFEKGADYAKAAALYYNLGQTKKACEMYEKAGDLENAADVCMTSGDCLEAARIYDKAGDKLKSAQAFEMSGNILAAARAYREAREYSQAAVLLREAGMLKEAADMYAISLTGQAPQTSNLDRYYLYASLLEAAKDNERHIEILKKIIEVEPDYRDVRERLKRADASAADIREKASDITIHEQAGEEVIPGPSKKGTTLRGLMRSGRMEPRYSLRLWVQVLKFLGQRQKEGRLPENLSPDSISIDGANNIIFSEAASKDFAYLSPETVGGAKTDQVSIIYALGIILFEMLTGSLDPVGLKKPGEVMQDVPPWLEELVMKCIEKNRDNRYQSFDEIFSALKSLKNRM